MFVLEIAKGAALIFSLAYLQGLLGRRVAKESLKGRVLSGTLFALVAILGMAVPLHPVPGVAIDARSVVICMAGFWGGPVVVAISGFASVVFRLWLGGPGVMTGTGIIVSSAIAGLVYRYLYRREIVGNGVVPLAVFGIAVHVLNFPWTLSLPGDIAVQFMETVSLPIFVIFTPATLVLGLLLKDIDKRSADEARLRESEQNYRDLTDGSIEGIVIHRGEKPLFANQAAARILGYDKPDAILCAGNSLDFMAPCERDRLRGYGAARLLGKPAPDVYEVQGLHKDGSIVWLLMTARVIQWKAQPAIQSTFLDITERKVAEAELQRQRRFVGTVLDSLSDGVIVCDADGEFRFLNKAVRATHGEANSPLSKSSRDAWRLLRQPDGESPVIYEDLPLVQARQGRAVQNREYAIQLPNGDRRAVLVNAAPMLDEAGNPNGAVAVIRDISDRKQAERALAESEERYRALVEGAMQGVIIHRDHKPLFVNRLWAERYGYTVDEILALESVLPLIAPPERAEAVRNRERRMSGGSAPGRYEFRGVARDGSWVWLENYSQIVTWDGEPAILSTIIDIEERKSQERALTESKERAEYANRAKTEFLANMSHELRTPLNSVIGFAEVLEGEYFGSLGSAKNREYVRDIKNSGRLLLRLINDILDVSKIEAGAVELSEEIVDPAEIQRFCIAMIRERANKAGVELVSEPQPGLPFLRADATMMKQILLNLLSNAVKFTAGGGSVEIRMEIDENGAPVLHVIDTGIGISPDDIDAVFEPFRQIGNVMTRRSEGTGLGLSLVKALTELHGGTVSIRSQLGNGTTVTVRLPQERIVGRQ